MYSKVNVFGKGFFFIKDASLGFIPAISLKTNSNTEVFTYGFCMVALFKLWGDFLRDIFAKHFLTKSQASNLSVATSLETMCLTKYIELAFNSKRLFILCKKLYLYWNVDAEISEWPPIFLIKNKMLDGFYQKGL